MAADSRIHQWLHTSSAQPLLLVTDALLNLNDFISEETIKDIELVQAPADGPLQIKQVHELLDQLQNKTLTGVRLVWIPDAHRLLPASANALLKTLEDTKRANRFLLTTPYPGRILATIRSRCRILRLPRVLPAARNMPLPVFDPKRKDVLNEEETTSIAEKLHQQVMKGSTTPGTLRTLTRLRDYYKATSKGVGQRAASDALLASLDDDVY